MSKLPIPWDLFMRRVEGRAAMASVEVKDGRPVFFPKPVAVVTPVSKAPKSVPTDVNLNGKRTKLRRKKAKGDPKDAKADAQPLIDVLRSEEPIPPNVRAWLADLLDENAATPLHLACTRRPRCTNPADTESWAAIDILRSGEELPAGFRAWLADLLDKSGRTALRLTFKKRGRGRRSADEVRNWPAGEFVERLVEDRVEPEVALAEAEARFDLSRAAVAAARKSLKAAKKEHDAIMAAEDGDQGEISDFSG